jgi:hypothetical protein
MVLSKTNEKVHGSHAFTRPLVHCGLAAWTCFFCLACSGTDCILVPDERFSINVLEPPACYPDPENPLNAAEGDIYTLHGRPDFIRFWWNPHGRFITTSDLSGQRDHLADKMATMKKSWIYVEEDLEIIFRPNGDGYLPSRPVSPMLKTICEFGDPSYRSDPLYHNGVRKENWHWIESGLLIELEGGVELTRKYIHQGTGQGTFLGK